MRKTLVALAMLLTAVCLAAGDPKRPEDKDEKGSLENGPRQVFDKADFDKADPANRATQQHAAHLREIAELRRELQDVEARSRAAEQQRADINRRLAEEKAEHQVRLATLEREKVQAVAAANAAQRDMSRLQGEIFRRQQAADAGVPGGPAPFGPRGGEAMPAQPKDAPKSAPLYRPPGQSADQKLDAILDKLEQMEARLRRLEAGERNRR
jgi:hypothetical protein